MKAIVCMLAAVVCFSTAANAQTDAAGCQDYALLTRLENFYISACEENFNTLTLRTGSNTTEQKEGNLFHLYYRYNFDAGAKAKSALQVIKNYEAAITKNGGKLLFRNTSGMEGPLEATYYFSVKDTAYWVQLTAFAGTDNAVEAYALNVLEMNAMKQEVDAARMFEAIRKEGFIALYINFETGKAAIEPESQPLIVQMAEMLKQNPELKISIEGHTDSTGNAKLNQLLSESRARAVMEALLEKGINKNRLSVKGWGQTRPVAGNNTEEGRARNRRVEIVKQ